MKVEWTREPIPDPNAEYFVAELHKGEWHVSQGDGYNTSFTPHKAWWMRSPPIEFPDAPEGEGEDL